MFSLTRRWKPFHSIPHRSSLLLLFTIFSFLDVAQSYPTTLIAAGAYLPESGYDSLDMSMPSYSVVDLGGFPQTDDVRPGEAVTQEKQVKVSKKKVAGPSRAEISAAKVAKAKADRVTSQAEQIAKMDAMKAQKLAAKE